MSDDSFRSCFFSKFSVDGGEQNLDWFDFCFQCIWYFHALKQIDGWLLDGFPASHGSNAFFKPTSWLKSGGFCKWKHVLFGKPRLKILKFKVSKYNWIECDGSFVQLAWLFVWKCLKVKDNDGFINLEAVAVDITFGVWCASKYSCFWVPRSKHTCRNMCWDQRIIFLGILVFPKATSHPKKCPRRASIEDFPMFGPAPLAFLKDVWSTLEDLKWSKMEPAAILHWGFTSPNSWRAWNLSRLFSEVFDQWGMSSLFSRDTIESEDIFLIEQKTWKDDPRW